MSNRNSWTHAVCDECYANMEPGRTPVKLREISKDLCCACGERQNTGITYRRAPDMMLCDGEHV